MMAAPFCKEKPQGERSTARRVASVAPSGWVAQLCPCPKFGARWSFQISRFLKSAGNPGCRRNHPIGVLLCGGLLPLGLCCSPKRGERRTKPLKPPVRALHRLGIYTQHTIRHLGSCSIIVVVGGPCGKSGRAGGRKAASGAWTVPASAGDGKEGGTGL
jgi:hypothetical protein